MLAEDAAALAGLAIAAAGIALSHRLDMPTIDGAASVAIGLLAFDGGTATSQAGVAIAAMERQVGERFPMIKRLFIEAGLAPLNQRWSRPDAIRAGGEAPSA